jgi:putative hydrolase of the HAD superfamily
MPIPSKIIIDLDDTIVDYSSAGSAAWEALIPVFAGRAGVTADALHRAIDEARRWYWSDMDRHREGRLNQIAARRAVVGDAFRRLGLGASGLSDELADTFSRDREIGVEPFPGALEALVKIQAAGGRMALLTNGDAALQRAKINRNRLDRYFTAILIEGETGWGKPAPEAYQAALASLAAEPADVWMVGDDPAFDITPARALGMHAAWIKTNPASDAQPPADLIAGSLSELVLIWEQSTD